MFRVHKYRKCLSGSSRETILWRPIRNTWAICITSWENPGSPIIQRNATTTPRTIELNPRSLPPNMAEELLSDSNKAKKRHPTDPCVCPSETRTSSTAWTLLTKMGDSNTSILKLIWRMNTIIRRRQLLLPIRKGRRAHNLPSKLLSRREVRKEGHKTFRILVGPILATIQWDNRSIPNCSSARKQ